MSERGAVWLAVVVIIWLIGIGITGSVGWPLVPFIWAICRIPALDGLAVCQ